MYAKLKPVQILGKTLDTLNVTIVNYSLGTSKPVLGYSIIDVEGSTIVRDNLQLDTETYNLWINNDEILLEYVAKKLNIEILQIHKVTKTSEEFLKEDPSYETK